MSGTVDQNDAPFLIVNDMIIFWINDCIISNDFYRQVATKYFCKLFTTDSNSFETCIDYLTKQVPTGTKILLFVDNQFIDRLVTMSLPHVIGIYGLGKKYFFRWKNTKVRCVFDTLDVKNIEKTVLKGIEDYFTEQWNIGVSTFQQSTKPQRSIGELSRENAQFMWYQLLIKTLIHMSPSASSKHNMLRESFLKYKDEDFDFTSYKEVCQKIMRSYTPKMALELYAGDSFVYRLLNEACRRSDIDLMFSFRFIIRDLFFELQKCYHEQRNYYIPNDFYRGTTMSQAELDILKRNVGNLISRHQFLSTSVYRDVASNFGEPDPKSSDETVRVLEVIYIDPDQCKTTPYASISHLSEKSAEGEILISIGSAFRIKSITKEKDKDLWIVNLDLVDYDEQITKELHHYLELSIEKEPNVLTLSNFLLWMGEYKNAIKYSEIFQLQLSENDSSCGVIDNHVAYALQKMGEFDQALQHSNQSIERLSQVSDEKQRIKLSFAYNNRGLIHKCRGEYQDALTDIQKALEMRQDKEEFEEEERKSLAVLRSHAHENLGVLYKDNTEYELAKKHLIETLLLREKFLPSNHHWISQTYNNLSLVYTAIHNFKEAKDCIEKAIEIQLQALPDTHPHLSAMYQTKGNLHFSLGEYEEARKYFEKAYLMYKDKQYYDPLAKAAASSNIGSVSLFAGQYSDALLRFKEALKEQRQYAPKHPNIIKNLNNIAMACIKLGHAEEALNYLEESLRLCHDIVGQYHENTAITYLIYAPLLNIDQYYDAMDCLKRVLNIYVEHLRCPYHKNVIECYRQMGIFERKIGHYEKAHEYFLKAIDTFKHSSVSNQHSLLTKIQNEIELTYSEQNKIHSSCIQTTKKP